MADFICHGQLDTKLFFQKFVVILQQIKQRGSLEGKSFFWLLIGGSSFVLLLTLIQIRFMKFMKVGFIFLHKIL